MKRELLVLLAAVALSVAMVPRVRRAVHLENDKDFKKSKSPQAAANICLPQTPCAWSVYKAKTKIVETNIVNTYCNCKQGTKCISSWEEDVVGAVVHYCRPPVNEDTES